MVFIIIALIICSILFGIVLYRTIDEREDWWGAFFSFICVIIQVICLFNTINTKKQKAIAEFEAGKYKKEVLYKTRFIDNQPVVIDSLVTYTKRKETKTYILQ